MKYLFLSILLILVFGQGFGQTPLETPTIMSVSYNDAENIYYIRWKESNYDNIWYFKLFVLNSSVNPDDKDLKDSIPVTGAIDYEDTISPVFLLKNKPYDLNKDTVYFVVQAFPRNTTNRASDMSIWKYGKAPCNIVLDADFDTSCYYTIKLNWNNYKGWASDVPQMYILSYTDEDGNTKRIKTTVNKPGKLIYVDTSIVVPGILKKDIVANNFGFKPGKKYKFQVAVSNSTETMESNVVEVDANLPQRPDFINTFGTTTDNDKIDVKYFFAPTEYNRFAILRSEGYNGNYESIGTFTFMSSLNERETAYTDNVNALEKQYFYRIQLLNNCKTSGVVLKQSDAESSIILKDKAVRNDVQLTWTAFKGFKNFHYVLYKEVAGNQTSEIISDTTITSVVRSLNLVPEQGKDNIVKFWIEAVKEDENTSQGVARSNIVLHPVSSKVVMQEYFTPNGDGKNDLFYVPIPAEEFRLIIYDRWGMKVFETEDVNDAWNGRYNNTGNLAPQGGYIYYFKYRLSPNEPAVEQRGSFLLILPK